MSVGGAERDQPLAPRTAERREADDREGRDEERDHREGHAAADAVQVAHVLLVGGDHDRARAEEEGDLADRMRRNVQARAEHAVVISERGAEHDVGELRDGRIRQPRLEVVFGERDERAHGQREGGHPHQPHRRAGAGEQIEPKHVDDDLEDGEDAGLHHGHGVEERAHGRGRDHRVGQPAVQRHERRFAASIGV